MREIKVGDVGQGVQEVKDALEQEAAGLFPEDRPVELMRIEYFSPRPDIASDGGIFEVIYKDSTRVSIIRRKVTGGNPATHPAFFWIPGGGLDARKWETTRLEWDGKDRLITISPDGITKEWDDEGSLLDEMVQKLRESMGRTRGIRIFVN